jgi:hypothetical protein
LADVFISYSRQDPEHTRALARELQRRGYSVWFDTDGLAPGDDFQKEIELAIEAAKAVIVIWTNKSKESEWVRFEATTAYAHRKLITTHAEGIDFANLPVPFNRLHSERCDNIEKVCAALTKLNVVPLLHRPPADDKAASRPAGFFDWVASRAPPHAAYAPEPSPSPSLDDYERELAAFRSAPDSTSRFFLPEDEPWNKPAPRSAADAPRYSRFDYHQLPSPPFEENPAPDFLKAPQYDDDDFFAEEEELEPGRAPEPPRRRVTVMDSVKRLFGKKDKDF